MLTTAATLATQKDGHPGSTDRIRRPAAARDANAYRVTHAQDARSTVVTTMAALRVLGGGRGVANGDNVTNEAVLRWRHRANDEAGSLLVLT